MPVSQMAEVVQHLRRMLLRKAGGSTDAQLLEQFVTGREETALESLVLRHGPMVWGVCRRILRNHHDAEDAFQATFLVLIRKAASIAPRDMLGNWLHGVAHRTALNGRALAARRSVHEVQVPVLPEPEVQPDSMSELRAVIDDEVSRLPANYRAVLVLCELEGRTRSEAAEQLGVPEGKIASRLARAKSMLAKRLTRGGVILSAAASATLLTGPAWSETLPPLLKASTVKAGLAFSAGQSLTSCGVSAAVVDLVKGGLAMLATKKLMFLAVIVLLTATLGSGIVYFAAGPDADRYAKRQAVGLPVGTPAVGQEQPNHVGRDAGQQERPGKLPETLEEDKGPLEASLPEGAIARLGTTRFRAGAPVRSMDVSPDGTIIAATGDANAVFIFDARTGKLRHRLGENMSSNYLCFSHDGKYLLSQDKAGVRVWNVASGKLERTFKSDEEIWRFALSHDGQTIALAVGDREKAARRSRSGRLEVREFTTDRVLRSFGEFAPFYIQKLVFHADGKSIIIVEGSGTKREVTCNDWTTGQLTTRFTIGPGNTDFHFSPDGRTLCTTVVDKGGIHRWEPLTGKLLGIAAKELGDRDFDFVLASEDTALIAVRSKLLEFGSPPGLRSIEIERPLLLIWDLKNDREIRKFTTRFVPKVVTRDGKAAFEASYLGVLERMDLTTGQISPTLDEHTAWIAGIAFSPDGKQVVTSDGHFMLRVWETATGKPIHSRKLVNRASRHLFTPDGKTLVSAISDHIELWNTGTWTPFEPGGRINNIAEFDISPDGKVLAGIIAFPANEPQDPANWPPDPRTLKPPKLALWLWDRATLQKIRDLGDLQSGPVAFSPTGSLLASVGPIALPAEGSVEVPPLQITTWNPADGKMVNRWALAELRPSPNPCPSFLQFGADGKTLCGGFSDGTVCLWDTETGKERLRVQHPKTPIYSVMSAITPDGTLIATGVKEMTRFWDAKTGKVLGEFRSQGTPVSCLSFSPDGKQLAIGGYDTTALVIDVARVLRNTDAGPDQKPAKDADPAKGPTAPEISESVAPANSYKVDPYIQTAVAYQAMGQEKVCEKLLEFAADPKCGGRAIVLCRMLFTKKTSGEFRSPFLGAPALLGGSSAVDWPLEPIELVDGVPFFITRGYTLHGKAESDKAYLEYCIQECDWSDFKFRTKGPNAKNAALDKLLASPKWKAPLGDNEKKFLTEQSKAHETGNEGAVSAVALREAFEQQKWDLEIGSSSITVTSPELVRHDPAGNIKKEWYSVSSFDVVRNNAAGKEEWSTSLNDNGLWHGLVGDSRRVFVYHPPSAAITAIDAVNGRVLWRKEGSWLGAAGNSFYWLSGDLLLVGLQKLPQGAIGGGRVEISPFEFRVLGLDAESGKERFNVLLPKFADSGSDKAGIVELSELFLVWGPRVATGWGRDGAGAVLIDRTGRVRVQLPRGSVDVIPTGKDWVCLTVKDLVRVNADGKTLWTLPFVKENLAGQIVKLNNGDFLACSYCSYGPQSDSGVHVIRFDPDSGNKRWQAYCKNLGIPPGVTGDDPRYHKHHARIDVVNGQVRVSSDGAYGSYGHFPEKFVELLDLDSGQQISRKIGRLEPIPGLTIGEAVKKLGMNSKECTIFDEPPGVARGVRGPMDDGRSVSLWISRQDGIFRENRDWTFEQISGLKVVQVEEKHGEK